MFSTYFYALDCLLFFGGFGHGRELTESGSTTRENEKRFFVETGA
jgi:hypothetical protein